MRALLLILVTVGLILALVDEPARAARRMTGDQHALLAAKLVRARRYDDAINEYQRALAAGAGHMSVFELAGAHRLAGHVDEALTNYRLFLKLAPRSPLRFEAKTQQARLLKLRKLARRPAAAKVAAAPPAAPAPVEAPADAPPVAEPPSDEASRTPPATTTATTPANATTTPAPVAATTNRAPTTSTPATPASEPDASHAAPPAPAIEARELTPKSDSAAAATVASTEPHAAPVSTSASPPAPASATVSPAREPTALAAPPAPRNLLLPSETALAPTSTDPLLRPVPLDVGELSGAALVFTGAVAAGAAIGLGFAALQQSETVSDSVRFDPEADAAGQRYAHAATGLAIVSVATLAAGGVLFAYHYDHWRRAHTPTAHPATATGDARGAGSRALTAVRSDGLSLSF